jgi:DNA polymerase III subunit beta
MKLSASREALLKPLQAVIGVVERRQTMPILANVLLVAKDDQLSVTATDLEVELVANAEVQVSSGGEVTVPGRKLLDICRALPENAEVAIGLSGEKLGLRSGKSKFSLTTLPAAEFPTIEDIKAGPALELPQESLARLLEKTHFSMAQQDVRYYLNGLLLETGKKHLRAVATDGHRLALCQVALKGGKGRAEQAESQVIVPRKGVLELQRLMSGEGKLTLELGQNHIRIQLDGIRFTSKLIDGRFPDYARVIPETAGNALTADRELFRGALQRTAILSNEKYRGIRLVIRSNNLVLQAHNPEQEEAEEDLEVRYAGEDIEIGFNVNYLLDALSAIESDEVTLAVVDGNSSCLLREPGNEDCKYVVMPMRL